jgi:hypothetical protein
MVVIDAELQDGELSQLAQAIQGAFGTQRVTAMRLTGPISKSLPNSDSTEDVEDGVGADVIQDTEATAPTLSTQRARSPKKIRTPNLDSELHPGAEPSLKAYADARSVTNTTSALTKFLVVAAWLSEERSGLKISADRAYTCFRFMGWPFNIDFEQPLRDLKAKSRYLELKPEDKGKGEFSITHLGLDKATKMKAAT